MNCRRQPSGASSKRSEFQAERVDAGAVLFEAEVLEDLWVVTDVGIDGGRSGQIVLAVLSAHVVFAISPDLVSLQDRLVVGCRHVACGPEAQQFIRHQERWVFEVDWRIVSGIRSEQVPWNLGSKFGLILGVLLACANVKDYEVIPSQFVKSRRQP